MHSTLLLRDIPKVPFQTVPALSHSLKVNCQVQTHSARNHKVEEEEVVVDLSSLCEDFFENVPPFIPCLCFFFFGFVFEVEISSCTLIPLFRPGSVHSGSAS